jgi:hypothetical protein
MRFTATLSGSDEFSPANGHPDDPKRWPARWFRNGKVVTWVVRAELQVSSKSQKLRICRDFIGARQDSNLRPSDS